MPSLLISCLLFFLILFLPPQALALQVEENSSAASFRGAENKRMVFKTDRGKASALLSYKQSYKQREENIKGLIVYLHPMVGITDNCAPSLVPRNALDNNDGMRWQLEDLLNQGYAILQPDFAGLGTKGSHPLMLHEKNVDSVGKALEATFEYNEKIAKDYLLLGYSQGAALAMTFSFYSSLYPGNLVGSVFLAPPSSLAPQIQATEYITAPTGASSILLYLLRTYEFKDLLSPLAENFLRGREKHCVLQLTRDVLLNNIPSSAILSPGDWRTERRSQFLNILRKTDPKTTIPGRSLFVFATRDTTVFPVYGKDLYKKSKKGGSKTDVYFTKADHLDIGIRSWPVIRNFIDSSFQKKKSTNLLAGVFP